MIYLEQHNGTTLIIDLLQGTMVSRNTKTWEKIGDTIKVGVNDKLYCCAENI
jgi:hypothetical protein